MDIYKQIYIQKLDTSTLECKYLLVYKGQYYEANYSIVELLTCLQKGETLNHGIDLYMRRKNGEFSYKQVEELIARFISPLFIEKETDEKMPITKGPFWYRRELFSSEMIGRFSDFFTVVNSKIRNQIFFVFDILNIERDNGNPQICDVLFCIFFNLF